LLNPLLVWSEAQTKDPGAQSSGDGEEGQTLDLTGLGKSITKFGQNLIRVLLEEKGEEENVIISPITIHKVLSMLYIGSPEDSNTFRQLSDALDLSSGPGKLDTYRNIIKYYDQIGMDKNENTILSLAGTMMMKDGFKVKNDYSQLMKSYFAAKSKIFKTPDEGVKLVNEWADEKTNGLIKEILQQEDIDGNTMMILASACYFKSDWRFKFKKEDTKAMDFTLVNKKKVVVEKGMNQNNIELRMARTKEFEVLELPYKNKDFNMYIALPKERSVKALNKVAADFSTEQFKDKLEPTTISHVQMPSFDATSEIKLNEPLKALGMTDMFGRKADFSKMTDGPLEVGLVKTKTVIKVDEEGSEAAAVAVAAMNFRSGGTRFVVNRPFVYMIHDNKNQAPLFIGRVMNPQED